MKNILKCSFILLFLLQPAIDWAKFNCSIVNAAEMRGETRQREAERNMFIRGNDTLRYRLLYPPHQVLNERYPLLIYLHGMGSRGHDNETPLRRLSPFLLDSEIRVHYPCFLLIPQCDTNDTWASFTDFPHSLSEKGTKSANMVLQLIHQLIGVKDIDSNRVYLTGYSMGGEGTYALLTKEPGFFACGVPVAGIGDTSKAALLQNIPLWAFHGDADDVNPSVFDELMIEAIKQKGGSPKFTQMKGIGHNCQDVAYSNSEFWQWIFKQRKK
jgi:predicted peptidase